MRILNAIRKQVEAKLKVLVLGASIVALGFALGPSGPVPPSPPSSFMDANAKPSDKPVIGDPARNGGPQKEWVNGYTRKNGTHVKGYWRSK